jgi:hypothetical protein
MATNDDLLRGAEEIGAAVEQHARALAESPDDAKAVIAAVNRLRTAAITYVVNAGELTGWGNPFSDLEDELEEEAEETAADDSGEESGDDSGAPPSVVKVEASYLVRVHDAEAARRHLAERGAAQEYSAEVSAAVTTDVVTDLFLADGWNPHQYGEEIIEVLEEKWSCGPDE